MAGDLDEGAVHVAYELEWCAHAAHLCVFAMVDPSMPDDYRQIVHTVAFETCLLHARNLIEILVPGLHKSYPGDIKAADFAPGWAPPAGSALDFIDKPLLTMIDRHLAHLSWERADDPPGQRPYVDILAALIELMDDLAHNAVHRGASERLAAAVAAAQAELAKILRMTRPRRLWLESTTTTGGTVVIVSGGVLGPRVVHERSEGER